MNTQTEIPINKNGCFSIFHNVSCMDCGTFLGTKEGERTIKDTFELCEGCYIIRLLQNVSKGKIKC